MNWWPNSTIEKWKAVTNPNWTARLTFGKTNVQLQVAVERSGLGDACQLVQHQANSTMAQWMPLAAKLRWDFRFVILYPLPSSCHLICHLGRAGDGSGWEKSQNDPTKIPKKKHVPMQLAARFPVHFVSSLRYISCLSLSRWRSRLWSRYTGVSEPITKKPCSLSKPTCAYILTLAWRAINLWRVAFPGGFTLVY